MNSWQKIKEKIKKAPRVPGVYIFSRSRAPLYVGKASNLRDRLQSYLSMGNFKNDRLQRDTTDLAFIPLRSEIEALIKEAELIKRYSPPYNVLWRDDKSYFYAAIAEPIDKTRDKEKFPRIFVVHKKSLPTTYHLPPTDFIGLFTEGRMLRLVLKMLRRAFPYCTCPRPHLRTCLNAQIGNCPGFCCRKESRPTSEQAGQYSKNIRIITQTLLGKPIRKIKNMSPEERNALEKILAHRDFLDMQSEKSELHPNYPNKREWFNSWHSDEFVDSDRVLVEGYDISHLSGRETVAGMTAWSLKSGIGRDAVLSPRKNFWRKFIIRTAKPADDPAAMRETLDRRLRHPEWPYPHAMIIDGGLAQFRAAKEAVAESGLGGKIKIFSFAKPERLVYGIEANPVKFDRAPSELQTMIPRIIAETHDFAIRFHRARRKKRFLDPETIML